MVLIVSLVMGSEAVVSLVCRQMVFVSFSSRFQSPALRCSENRTFCMHHIRLTDNNRRLGRDTPFGAMPPRYSMEALHCNSCKGRLDAEWGNDCQRRKKMFDLL